MAIYTPLFVTTVCPILYFDITPCILTNAFDHGIMSVYPSIPVVPHKAVAEVSEIGNL